jgi:nucleoside phosphorylase
MAGEAGGKLINNEKIKSVLIGVGKESIKALEFIPESTDLVILLGTAGALDDKLNFGDIVVVNSYISLDGLSISADPKPYSLICSILEKEGQEFQTGSSLTVPIFGQGIHSKAATILNMEDFYIAQALRKKRIPMATVRIISDLGGGRESLSRDEMIERVLTSSVILREKFVIPFLKAKSSLKNREDKN